MTLAVRLIFALLALLLCVRVLCAQPRRKGLFRIEEGRLVKFLDKNRDRRLTLAEACVPNEMFYEADTNKDKVIGPLEFNGLFTRFAGYCIFRYRARADGTLTLSEARKLALPLSSTVKDLNGDGTITWSEWWKSNAMPRRVWGFRIDFVPIVWMFFQPFDLDGDGIVSKSEAVSLNLELRHADKNNDGIFTMREAATFFSTTLAIGEKWWWLMIWDSNFDGVVSADEWQTDLAKRKSYDANGDGKISLLDLFVAPDGPDGEAFSSSAAHRTTEPIAETSTSQLPTTEPSNSKLPTTEPSISQLPITTSNDSVNNSAVSGEMGTGAKFLVFFLVSVVLGAYGLRKKDGSVKEPTRSTDIAQEQVEKSNLRMAKTYLRRNRFEKAASYLQNLVNKDSDKAIEARVLLIEAFLKSGNKEAAASQMEQLVLHEAPLADIYRLALTFEELEEPERARTILNAIYARNVKFKDVSVRLKRLSETQKTLPGRVKKADEEATVIPDRYSDLHTVGSGGMGQVYSAYDKLLLRKVALKVLIPALAANENVRKRFAREARAMAQLNHPSILPIFDVSPTGHYFTMPLLRGTELDDYADLSPPFSDRLQVAIDTTSALCHAHEEGILHRDIKPANILVSSEGVPYLMDFGLAKLDDDEVLTATDEQLGTLFYMAPELLEGATADERCDIYSLGLSLYRLFTGRSLFDDTSGLAARLYTVNHSPPSEIDGSLPKALDDIVLRCVARHPDDRYQNTNLLLQDLMKLKDSKSSIEDYDKTALLVASRAEELYRQHLHRLKNLLAICCRYADDREKLVSRFYSLRTLEKIKELTDEKLIGELTNLVSMVNEKEYGSIGEAIKGLASLIPTFQDLSQSFIDLQSQSVEERAIAVINAYEELTPKIKDLAASLEGMEVSLDEIARAAAASAPTVNISVETKLGATIRVVEQEKTRSRLIEVMENIYQNAAQANARNVTVTIGLSDNESHSVITVTNDGLPMDEETSEQLFIKAVTTKADGTGTGMISCRERLCAMNGTISLEETNPVTFTLTLWRGRVGTAERSMNSA